MRTTRHQLQQAIEAGITAAEDNIALNFDVNRLREVGRTATMVAVGDYQIGEVGCPVTQAFPAGLCGLRADLTFALEFDRKMRDVLGDCGRVIVEVVG